MTGPAPHAPSPFPHTIPQDTPITRATIADLTPAQLEQLVETFRVRRMAAYTAFQEGQRIKAEAKCQKDAQMMQKRLDQITKCFQSIDTQLERATRYSNEIKLLAMTAGD